MEALILVCVVGLGPQVDHCDEVENTRGLFDTKEECVARVEEMKRDAPTWFLATHGFYSPAFVVVQDHPDACVPPGEEI